MKRIDSTSRFSLDGKQHEFRFRRIVGLISDMYEIYIDGQPVVRERLSDFDFSTHSRQIHLDGTPCEITWNQTSGDPKTVAVSANGRVLASYEAWTDNFSLLDGPTTDDTIESGTQPTMVRVTSSSTSREIVGSERVTIDNRYGSDSVTRRTDVSKTVERTFSTSVERGFEGSLSASLFSIINTELALKLTQASHYQVGETMTRSENIELIARAGEENIYELIWTVQVDRGVAEFELGRSRHFVAYESRHGLELTIRSHAGS